MSSSRPTPLEMAAIAHALVGAETWKRQLLDQLDKLSVAMREDTGVGFYTYFATPAELPKVEIPLDAYSVPPQCLAVHPEIPGGAFFLVWLNDGRIDCLEGATGRSQIPDEKEFVFV